MRTLRPELNARPSMRRRASSAPRERWQESYERQAYQKMVRAYDGAEEQHKFSSNRHTSAFFASAL